MFTVQQWQLVYEKVPWGLWTSFEPWRIFFKEIITGLLVFYMTLHSYIWRNGRMSRRKLYGGLFALIVHLAIVLTSILSNLEPAYFLRFAMWTSKILPQNLHPPTRLVLLTIPRAIFSAVSPVLRVVWLAFSPLILLDVFACAIMSIAFEALVYAWPWLILLRVWSIIYIEIWKRLCLRYSPQYGALAQARSLKSHIHRLDALTEQHRRYTTSTTRAAPAGSDVRAKQALRRLDQPFKELSQDSISDLRSLQQAFIFLIEPPKPWGKLDQPFTSAVMRSVKAQLLRRLGALLGNDEHPSAFTLTSTTHELAGIFVKYLVPLPFLQDFAQPFRLSPFCIFFMAPSHCRLYGEILLDIDAFDIREEDSMPTPSPSSAGKDFLDAIQNFLEIVHEKWTALEVSSLLGEHLSFLDTQVEVMQAETAALEAILDGVLLWKERKNELEKKRFKQD